MLQGEQNSCASFYCISYTIGCERNNLIDYVFHRFSINLQCGPNTSPRDDVALHLTVDFFRKLFIRNSIQNMSWGVEENFGGMSLSAGQQFRISIVCEPSQFVVSYSTSFYN